MYIQSSENTTLNSYPNVKTYPNNDAIRLMTRMSSLNNGLRSENTQYSDNKAMKSFDNIILPLILFLLASLNDDDDEILLPLLLITVSLI